MSAIELQLPLNFIDFALFPDQFIHEALQLADWNLHYLAAVGVSVLGRALLLVLVGADLDVLRLHLRLSGVVLDLESLVLRNGSLAVLLVLLVDPFSLQVSVGLLEGPDQPDLIVLLVLLPLAHVLLLVALQFNGMLLLREQVVIDLRLFGEVV
jgi:hypothetical protein